MKKLAIIGAAELGSLITHYVSDAKQFQVVGFYDDFKTGFFNELPILGKTQQIENDFQNGIFDEIIIAIGYNYMPQRRQLFDVFSDKIPFATIIHPSAYVDASCKIGKGTIIFAGCVLDQFAEIGDNVLLNAGVCVAHHTSVGNHCFLAPRVALAGRIEIKEQCFIGIGAIIKDLIIVENNATIGAGALVLKNIEANSTYFGSPAKKIN